MKRPFTVVMALCAIGFTSCAENPYQGIFASLAPCRGQYAELDAKVDAAGARSSIYYRVKGFPYFRMDRLHASYRDAMNLSIDEMGAWTRHMRDYDQQAREIEFINMGMSLQERAGILENTQACGRGLAQIELEDPRTLAKLRKAAAAPDEYQGGTLSPADAAAIRAAMQAQADAFRAATSDTPADGTVRKVWKVHPLVDPSVLERGMDYAPPDELGFQSLTDSAWKAMSERFAPEFWIETAGDSDLLGWPKISEDGPGVDVAKPHVGYWVNFTKFGDLGLAQITYVLWFPGSGAQGNGPIDSVMWRVTLDRTGTPLVYDSIHASGREHRWFPAQPMTVRTDLGETADPPVVAPNVLAQGPVAVVIASGSHTVRRVVPAVDGGGAAAAYELQRYEDVYALPLTSGKGTRSLFDPDGEIPGTRHADPLWRKGTGLDEQGTLRALGRQPTGYLSHTHFDDVRVLEEVFVPPPAVAKTLDSASLPAAVPVVAGN